MRLFLAFLGTVVIFLIVAGTGYYTQIDKSNTWFYVAVTSVVGIAAAFVIRFITKEID